MAGDVQVTFAYDYLSRRVAKRVYTYDPNASPAWVLTKDRRFIWDGWLMLREIKGSVGVPPASPTTVATYLWGLDLAGQAEAGQSEPRPQGSGSFAAGHGGPALLGAGGIGGLIAVNIAQPEPNTPGGTFIYCYDGNGNVTQLVRPSTGTLSAKYDYDPYGTRVNAPAAGEAVQPWRFSTKQTDAETGLQYFGYRYRDRERWISRDPLEEDGGTHVYSYAMNQPLVAVDPDGRDVRQSPGTQPAEPPIDTFDPNSYLGGLVSPHESETACGIFMVRETNARGAGHPFVMWQGNSVGSQNAADVAESHNRNERLGVDHVNRVRASVTIYTVKFMCSQTLIGPGGNAAVVNYAFGAGPKKGQCCTKNCEDIVACLTAQINQPQGFDAPTDFSGSKGPNCNSFVRIAFDRCCLTRGDVVVNGYTWTRHNWSCPNLAGWDKGGNCRQSCSPKKP